MATIAEIRDKYPQYSDLSDMQLARALHGKHYSDMEFGTFAKQIGMLDEEPESPVSPLANLTLPGPYGIPLPLHPEGYRTALEGAGKFFTDLGLGSRQLAGSFNQSANANPAFYRPDQTRGTLQAEAQTKREIDAPLMKSYPGKLGYFGAGAASTLPLGAIPGAASIPGSAAIGAGLGALQPSTSGGEQLFNTAAGGALGAGVPWLAGKASSLLAPRPPLLPQGGSAGASASAAGSLSANASPIIQNAVARLQQQGKPIEIEALKRMVEADTLPVPIRITKGQASRDPVVISEETNSRAANTQYADLFKEQHEGLVKNLSALREEVGPNVFTTNPVEHGDTLINAYRAKDAAAEAEIKRLYDTLRTSFGDRVPVNAAAILKNSEAALHKALLFDHAPSAEMNALRRMAEAKSMTFENFEAMRTNLATIMRSSANGNERRAAGIIRGELENLPLMPGSGADRMKPIADAARSAARARFQALEADPAYEAAVNGTVPPDRFVQKFIVGGTRDQVSTMRAALAGDPAALETMGTAAFDHLRSTAGVDAFGNGAFSQARYNKQLTALDPKLADLFPSATAEKLRQLGNVARTIQAEVPGSFVNRSNTFTALAGKVMGPTAEGVLNVTAGGVPVGTFGRWLLGRGMSGRQFNQSVNPANIIKPIPPRK